MIPNDALINRLRALGFSFKDQTDRMMVYKKAGTTKRVMVRRNTGHDVEYVRVVLTQAGAASEDIDNFIAAARHSH